jgi:hypothetical protein
MISNRKIRQWFRTQINDATIDLDDFAWENRQFDGSGKELFYQERFAVSTEQVTTNQESAKWGIMWYDVITDKGSGTETSEDAAKAIADIFAPADNKEQEIETGLKIDIDVATTGSRADFDDNRTFLPVRIEFRAYEVTS